MVNMYICRSHKVRCIWLDIGSIVRIEDNNEWKGLYGIVKYKNENESYIFCIQNPCYLYRATEKNNIVVM